MVETAGRNLFLIFIGRFGGTSGGEGGGQKLGSFPGQTNAGGSVRIGNIGGTSGASSGYNHSHVKVYLKGKRGVLQMSKSAFLAALVFTLCLAPTARSVRVQKPTEQNTTRYHLTEPKPTNCENHIAILEAAHHDAGKEGLIIVIARRGPGENRRDLNRRRLYNARAYLTDYLRLRAPETIVTAEGEPVKGYGRIELYVGGKLNHVLALKRNADLVVGSCEPEALDDARQRQLRLKLYPWRDRNPSQR